MEESGWLLNIYYSNGHDISRTNERICGTETFYGYRPGDARSSVSTTFKGHGTVKLSYGNCELVCGNYGNCRNYGYVSVSLNGVEISRSTSNGLNKTQDTVSFKYRESDVLNIEAFNRAIIKLYFLSFTEE